MHELRTYALLVGLAGGCGRVHFEPLAAPDAPADAARCPAGYEERATGCYRFQIDVGEVGWLAAEASCEADGPGAHLIVIDDAAELAMAELGIGAAMDAWIGGSDRITEGVYLAVTGGAVPLVVWGAGQPIADDCMTVLSAGGMGTRSCSDTNDFICEHDGRSVDPSTF